MGPPQATEALRDTLGLGVDDAVLLSDRAFAGSDTWATSTTLSAAIRKMGDVDLILCGKQAIDGDTAQVGPEMAALLDIPYATFVKKIELLETAVLSRSCARPMKGPRSGSFPCRLSDGDKGNRRTEGSLAQAQDARQESGNPRRGAPPNLGSIRTRPACAAPLPRSCAFSARRGEAIAFSLKAPSKTRPNSFSNILKKARVPGL